MIAVRGTAEFVTDGATLVVSTEEVEMSLETLFAHVCGPLFATVRMEDDSSDGGIRLSIGCLRSNRDECRKQAFMCISIVCLWFVPANVVSSNV